MFEDDVGWIKGIEMEKEKMGKIFRRHNGWLMLKEEWENEGEIGSCKLLLFKKQFHGKFVNYHKVFRLRSNSVGLTALLKFCLKIYFSIIKCSETSLLTYRMTSLTYGGPTENLYYLFYSTLSKGVNDIMLFSNRDTFIFNNKITI